MKAQNIAAILTVLVSAFSAHASGENCQPEKGVCRPVNFQKIRTQSETEVGCFHSLSIQRPVCYSVTFPLGASPLKTTPYALFLHGRGADHRQFQEMVQSCASTFKNQVYSFRGPPVPIVAPAQTVHTYWKNSVSGVKVADMVTKDLVRHVERQSQGYLEPRRAGVGISMGGHGVVFLAMREPKFFSSVYSISPIFRGEKELLPEDRDGFGEGQRFLDSDPMSLWLTRGFPDIPLTMEIGSADGLLQASTNTQALFHLATLRYPRQVWKVQGAEHDLKYWCGSLKNSMKFISQTLTPTGS